MSVPVPGLLLDPDAFPTSLQASQDGLGGGRRSL